jgi:hypothetical protein
MDDQAFAPGTLEAGIAEKATVLMGGNALKNKRGHLLITNDRVVFSDQRFDPAMSGAVGGPLAGMLATALESRRKGKPPLLDFPMSDITRVSHVKKLTVRDGGDEHRFSEGYATIAPVLRRSITERHGQTIQDEGPEAWRVAD